MKNWIDIIGNAQKSTETTRLDELGMNLNIFKPRTDPHETDEDTEKRRLADVTRRANDEKKSYGFLRSISKKVFGKKAAPVEEPKPERSEEDRRASVVARARSEGKPVAESFHDDDDDEIEQDYTMGWASRDHFELVLDALASNGQISYVSSPDERETTFHVTAVPDILAELDRVFQDIDDGER